MHFCHEDVFIFANNADPDEILHHAAFHLGLHCLPKYLLTGIQNEKLMYLTSLICWHCSLADGFFFDLC